MGGRGGGKKRERCWEGKDYIYPQYIAHSCMIYNMNIFKTCTFQTFKKKL